MQHRRERQHVADVVEAVADVVGGEVLGGLEIDADEVADGVVVLGAVEPADGDAAGVGLGVAVGPVEDGRRPAGEGLDLGGGGAAACPRAASRRTARPAARSARVCGPRTIDASSRKPSRTTPPFFLAGLWQSRQCRARKGATLRSNGAAAGSSRRRQRGARPDAADRISRQPRATTRAKEERTAGERMKEVPGKPVGGWDGGGRTTPL